MNACKNAPTTNRPNEHLYKDILKQTIQATVAAVIQRIVVHRIGHQKACITLYSFSHFEGVIVKWHNAKTISIKTPTTEELNLAQNLGQKPPTESLRQGSRFAVGDWVQKWSTPSIARGVGCETGRMLSSASLVLSSAESSLSSAMATI